MGDRLFVAVLPPSSLVGSLAALDYRIFVNWETLEPDSDIQAFARDRLVSVTPLSHDMTSRTDMAALRALLDHSKE